MKAVLRFDLDDPDDKAAFDSAMNGQTNEYIIDQIWEKCFRPARKGGYDNPILDTQEASDVIEELIKIYNEVIEENRE